MKWEDTIFHTSVLHTHSEHHKKEGREWAHFRPGKTQKKRRPPSRERERGNSDTHQSLLPAFALRLAAAMGEGELRR